MRDLSPKTRATSQPSHHQSHIKDNSHHQPSQPQPLEQDLSPANLLALQRVVGNKTVQRLLASRRNGTPAIQRRVIHGLLTVDRLKVNGDIEAGGASLDSLLVRNDTSLPSAATISNTDMANPDDPRSRTESFSTRSQRDLRMQGHINYDTNNP